MAHIYKKPQWGFFVYVSHLPGLNRGPYPYHGYALPTELRWLVILYPVTLKFALNLSISHTSHSMDAAYSSCSGCMKFFKISTTSCDSLLTEAVHFLDFCEKSQEVLQNAPSIFHPDCLTLPTELKWLSICYSQFGKCEYRRIANI